MFCANDQISLQILDCCQWVDDYDDLSCLGLAAREGALGQDTEDVTDIALSCHHQVHWWIMWIFMVTRQWQFIIVSSVQLWRVCTTAHCGDWRRVPLVRIRILVRGDTISDQTRPHSIVITPDTIIWLTDSGWSEDWGGFLGRQDKTICMQHTIQHILQ